MTTKKGEELIYKEISYKIRGGCFGFLINFGSKKLEIKRRIYEKAREVNDICVNPRLYPRLSASTSRGFTLVEIMVVVAIIVIMSAIVFINYRPGSQQLALQRSANKLAQDIRRAQQMAMSSAKCEPCGNIVPDRYGIWARKGDAEPYYYIFADRNNDGIRHGAHDTNIEQIYYEEGIILSEISQDDCVVGGVIPPGHRRMHITFKPPDPTTELIISGPPAAATVKGTCSQTILTLRVGTSGPTRTVRINNAGLIYVE